MRVKYKSTTARFHALLQRKEITYNLLPFLFKLGAEIHCICAGTDAPRCLKYVHGEEEVTANGSTHFSIQGYYFDFDGVAIGEATGILRIEKVRGPKRIDTLGVYPLQFHREAKKLKTVLVQDGRIFLSLRGIHHCHYHGLAFRLDDRKEMHTYQINSRIMIDTVGFHESNPKYPGRRVRTKKSTSFMLDAIWGEGSKVERTDLNETNQVKRTNIDPEDLDDKALIFFSPLVLGFSMKDRLFRMLSRANDHDYDIS